MLRNFLDEGVEGVSVVSLLFIVTVSKHRKLLVKVSDVCNDIRSHLVRSLLFKKDKCQQIVFCISVNIRINISWIRERILVMLLPACCLKQDRIHRHGNNSKRNSTGISLIKSFEGDYCQTKFQAILHIFNVQELASAIKDLMSNIFILALSNLY